jgi:hypothetical protein
MDGNRPYLLRRSNNNSSRRIIDDNSNSTNKIIDLIYVGTGSSNSIDAYDNGKLYRRLFLSM